MESNPWQVDSIQAFNCLKCPECMFFSQEELDFKAHAMKNHPMSNAFFNEFESNSFIQGQSWQTGFFELAMTVEICNLETF